MILLHICCGPCSVQPFDVLKREGESFVGFFYNPNVQPYREYLKRLETLERWAEDQGVTLEVSEGYDIVGHLRRVLPYASSEERCLECYRMRMIQTARVARKLGFKQFTTTLLASPYQKHEMVVAAARQAEAETGVRFKYYDFRPGYRAGIARAREAGMYLQPYCGCVLSEVERYRKGGLRHGSV